MTQLPEPTATDWLGSDAITRSVDHKYTWHAMTFPGVTTILGVLDKSGPLMTWAANQTADAAITLGPEGMASLIEAAGPEGFKKAITSRSEWKRDEAAQLGTQIHALADLVVQGQPTPPMAEPIRNRVLKYADWWKASGWTLRLSEAMVVNPEFRWGGTFDLLAFDREGKTVCADVKSGKGVYKEAVLQVTAYGMSSHVQPAGADKTYPMPVPDRYVILHVTEDGVREVEVHVGQAEKMAWLACLDLYSWTQSVKGLRL